MYLWRLSIAITLGLVWYFSDCGRTVTQYFLCFLFCFTTPLLWGNSGRESSTQTDEETKENTQQEKEEQLFGDLIDGESGEQQDEPADSEYPHVKRSLQQVFECAYAQLVLPWYSVPEPPERQPLHQVLSREVDFVIDRIIERAKDFDVCQAVVGSIRILTQHLHNAKQSDRDLLFTSRADEIAFLRDFSDALVRNLFPKSLWSQEVNRCALNEIVAIKGLGLLVTWLSDPDNLNQLVVSQLDSVTPKGSVDELCGSDLDLTSLASQEAEGEGSEVSLEGAGISTSATSKTKRKGNKLKEGWSKFVDKVKSKKAKKKKMKKMEQELVMRIMAIQGDMSNEDDVSSREGSVYSQQDSDREDSDLENYLTSVQEDMMEFKLSYEMWRVGRWAVSIPHADWEDDELNFMLHLEEKDSPENLQWDIKKTYMDVIYFRNRWQDSASLPSILVLENSELSDAIKEEARVSVQRFLQELVADNMIGHTQPVFQFLCPLDKLLNEEEHYGGVWSLLSGLAYFLTPGQEEEETSSPQTETQKGIATASLHPESTALPSENPAASAGNVHDVPDATIPTIVISQFDPPSEPPEEARTETEPPSANGNCSQDKTEESDNPLTSHFKMIFKGLARSRSQESLASTKSIGDEDPPETDSTPRCSQNGGLHGDSTDSPSWLHFSAKSNKKEKICFKMSGGANKAKGKDQGTLPRGEESQCQKSPVNWEQLEATKAIFDLLKEISGNSILINIFDAILKPVMPILKKKVNSFLNKMNPTEQQMAAYIDTLREKQWPDCQPAAPSPPRTEDEKNETRDRAHSLINARYSNYLVLKKTDMDSVFNLFQDREENKTLVYMLLSFLLREFFPNEHSLNVSAAALQKVTNSTN
uniref:sorting nexin-25 n=1 Tax=Semicossyphus pulcher TaxID=241346 RepID=UPI0037E6FD80